MAEESLLVGRNRAIVVFVALFTLLVALVFLLVHVHEYLVVEMNAIGVARIVEVAAGLAIVSIMVESIAILGALRRARRLRRALDRAIRRKITTTGTRTERFSEFGELGAAIGEFGRSLERRDRVMVERLRATERAIKQILTTVEDEVIVLDGAGRVYAASSGAGSRIVRNGDTAPRVEMEPPASVVLRALLAGDDPGPILVGQTPMYATPVFVERGANGHDRSLVYLILTRREVIRRLDTGVRESGAAADSPGFFRAIVEGLLPNRRRRR